jgi:membrane-associated phospholipid phosphatase
VTDIDVKDSAEDVAAEPAPITRRRRAISMLIWAAAFGTSWLFFGLPATDPLQAFIWMWAATIAWNSNRPWRAHLRFGRDWLLVVVLLEAYNYSRGFAYSNASPHITPMIRADKFMTGWFTGGEVPTVWLQNHLYHPDKIHFWDVVTSWVYFSHFVATPALALIFWLQDRDRWLKFVRRWFVLSVAGVAVYFIYPAAPPWWAAARGYIEPVSRISTRGWAAFGMHGTGNLLQTGQLASDPVAAMPSLHSAFALLVTVSLLPVVRRRWWPLLFAYPLVMTFALVYSGEHYLTDVIVGWIFVGVSIVIADAYGRFITKYRKPGSRSRPLPPDVPDRTESPAASSVD